MSLRVWLPLLSDAHNQGASDITPIVMGTGITYTAGKLGNAATFPNNCASCIHMPGLKLQVLSWCCWFKCTGEGSATSQRMLSEGRDTGSVGTNIWLSKAGTTLYWSAHKVTGSTTVALNTWYHVALTCDGSKVHLYLDGKEIGTGTAYSADSDYAQSNDSFVIGKMAYLYTAGGNYFPFCGQMNDVRIYDHCLSAAEVKEISQGLVLHYKLDLPNPNLLTGTKNFGTGWGGTGVTEHNAFDEIFSVKTRDNTDGTGYSDTAVFNKATVVYPGETYTASFWAKGSDAHNIICYFYDNTSGLVQVASGRSSTGATTSSADGGLTFPITTEWKKYWCTWTFNNTANPAQKSLIIGRLAKGLGETSIAKVKLEKGDKATAWTFHVKDEQYRILGLNGSAELLSGNPTKTSAWVVDGATITQVDNQTISFTPSSDSGRIYNSSASVWMETGAKYVFSCYAKADADGRTLRASRSIANYAPTFTLTTAWKYYSGVIASTDNTTGGTLSLQSANGATVYIQHPHLVKQCNRIEDCSGYGHHAEVVRAVEASTNTPRYETSTHFSATDQYLRCTGLTTAGFGSSYTFAWWGKCETYSGRMMWGFSDGIRLNGVYNGVLWNTGDGSNNPLYKPGTTTAVAAPSINEWHHFAMVGDGSTCKAYLDGKLWGQAKTYKNISGTTIYFNGWDSGTSYSNSDASLSDFRMYCTALSAEDVLELYHTSAKVDNLGGIHTGEFIECDESPTVTKTAQHKNGTFIENGSAPAINMTSWSYKPAANAQNQTHNSCVVDFSEVQPLLRSIRVHAEYDISWSGMKAGTGGTFAVRLQGSINKLDGTNTWSGTNWGNYIIADNSASILTSSINANENGTHHFTVTKTIPAGWFEYYNAMCIGARTDYGDGTGTISCSNIKVTYETDCAKIGDSRTLSTEFIEK